MKPLASRWSALVAFAFAATSLATSGCTGTLDGESEEGATGPTTGTSSGPGGSTGPGGPGVGTDPQGSTPDLDHPPIDEGALPQPSAGARRLSLAQLRASLPVMFGMEADGVTPITWHMPSGSLGLDAMAGSLGEPDWIEITEESLEPSPMYAKFMDDLARDVCNRALLADLSRPSPSARVIVREVEMDATSATDAAGVGANLRYLLLRLQGLKIAADDAAALAPYRALFDGALADATTAGLLGEEAGASAWGAVCVGLVVSPEFHLY